MATDDAKDPAAGSSKELAGPAGRTLQGQAGQIEQPLGASLEAPPGAGSNVRQIRPAGEAAPGGTTSLHVERSNIGAMAVGQGATAHGTVRIEQYVAQQVVISGVAGAEVLASPAMSGVMTAPPPDVRVRLKMMFTLPHESQHPVLMVVLQNHSPSKIFALRFRFVQQDGSRVRVRCDALGSEVLARHLEPGEEAAWHLSGKSLFAAARESPFVGLMAIDAVDREFFSNPQDQETINILKSFNFRAANSWGPSKAASAQVPCRAEPVGNSEGLNEGTVDGVLRTMHDHLRMQTSLGEGALLLIGGSVRQSFALVERYCGMNGRQLDVVSFRDSVAAFIDELALAISTPSVVVFLPLLHRLPQEALSYLKELFDDGHTFRRDLKCHTAAPGVLLVASMLIVEDSTLDHSFRSRTVSLRLPDL